MTTRSTKSKALPAGAVPKRTESGRPSAYRAEFCLLARNLTLIELTIEELGQAMNVATSPINLWIKTHKSFSEAITHARVQADAQVAASLFDQAIGYEYVGIEAFKMKDEKTGAERIDLVPIPKYVPKNVVAAYHWLHNRQLSCWKVVHVEDNTSPRFSTHHEQWFCCRRWGSTARGQLRRRRGPECVMPWAWSALPHAQPAARLLRSREGAPCASN